MPVGFCGPTQNQSTKHFLEKKRRLERARLFVLDEFSMIGRMMMGKILFRVAEKLGKAPKEFGRDVSMGGRDVVMAGDEKQAQPVGDEALYRDGGYTGKGLNKPRKGEAPAGTPSHRSLVHEGLLFREEFDDVVILRKTHRVDFGNDQMAPGERAEYAAEADKFLEVTLRMAECKWTPEEHAWLARRNRSRLQMTKEGRE